MPTVQKEEQGAPSQLSQQCERPCECTLTSDPTKKTVSYKAGYRLKIYRSFKSLLVRMSLKNRTEENVQTEMGKEKTLCIF